MIKQKIRSIILFSYFTVLALFLVIPIGPIHPARASQAYYVASLDMDIDPGAQDWVTTAVNDAVSVGADHFVLVLNTNGGSGNNMENIINKIIDYENNGGNFTTLIAPSARHAFSAGAFIAESSTQIFMAQNTVIGSATPIITGIPGEEINSTLTKDKAAFAAYMRELTARWNRNDNETARMVNEGVSFGAIDAARLRVVDGFLDVSTLGDALSAIGVPAGTSVHEIALKSQVISVLSDPNVGAILFLLGTFAILADLTHPTLVLTFVGAAAIALALFGLGLFGAGLISIILMILGAAFIFLEIKTHHGISATIGVIIFIIGFLLIFHTSPATPSPPGCTINCPPPTGVSFEPISILTYAILGVIGSGLVVGSLYLYKIREALSHVPVAYDTKSIIGKSGTLTSDLKAGSVATANVASEDWTVTGSEDLPKGTRVLVKSRMGLKLLVEAETPPEMKPQEKA